MPIGKVEVRMVLLLCYKSSNQGSGPELGISSVFSTGTNFLDISQNPYLPFVMFALVLAERRRLVLVGN